MLTQNTFFSRPKTPSPFSWYSLLLLFCSLVISLVFLVNVHRQWLVTSSPTTIPEQQVMTKGTTTKAVSVPQTAPSQALIRLDQSQVSQYTNAQEYNTWWASACSAAAMTEIINAYEHKQDRIADILAIEAGFQNPQVISADAGLLYLAGIDRTMASFGLRTSRLVQPTVQQIVHWAQTGTPVLVNFPPDRFAGGHFLVVIGGDASTVRLTDSSQLNMQVLSYARFSSYWGGFAETFALQPAGTSSISSVLGKPTITAEFLNKVLAYYGSPAAGKGQALYDLGVKYGIDPVFALAFFGHESTFGTRGEAAKTMSIGNLRCINTRPCADPSIGGGYAQMKSWEDGIEVWYQLIRNVYVTDWGARSIEQIIPHYAPSSDNNDEAAYITALKQSIVRARGGLVDIENF